MSRNGRNTYDSFNEPLGSSGYRRSEDDYDSYSANHGPGSGLTGFYVNNKRRIFICLAVSVAVIVLIAIIAAVASKKDDNTAGPSPPGQDDQWITIGNLPAYREGTDPRVLLYLPDVYGRRQAAIDHVTKFGQNGFTTYLMDYFDGGTYNSSNPNHQQAVAAQRVRDAVAVLRQQDHITSIQVTGYCYGGGVAVLLADGTGGIDSAVGAHTAIIGLSYQDQAALISNIVIPTFFIMVHSHSNSRARSTHSDLPRLLPTDKRCLRVLSSLLQPQYDYPGTLITTAPSFLNITIADNQEVAYKSYTGVSHGFAVVVDQTIPLDVAMQQRAFDDTIDWLNIHSFGSPAPEAAQYTNMTLGDLNTYVFGSGSAILWYLQDAAGVRNESLELAGWYANAGFTVYYPDYFNGGSWNRADPTQSVSSVTQRVAKAHAILRQQYPNSTIQATGYCFGGGVGVNLLQTTDPMSSVDSGVFAHASLVTPALVAGIQRPVSFVMPQNDTGFNNYASQYLATTMLDGVEAEYKTYPNTSHGFAVSVNTSLPLLVAMKLLAYQDSARWLNTHRFLGSSWPIPAPPVTPTGGPSSSSGVGSSSTAASSGGSSTMGSSGSSSIASSSSSSSSVPS